MSKRSVLLSQVGYYACPVVTQVRPTVIADRTETVEILTGGKLRFELEGEERVFERGTVFWHQAGEHTICKTFEEDPYRCVVFRFQVSENGRPGPRVSSWETPEEAVAFAEECHKAFHRGGVDLAALSDYAYSVIHWKASTGSLDKKVDYPGCFLRACAFIKAHLEEDLTPDRIAKSASISRPYLFTLFRKYYNTAPLHYVQMLRITQAKVMLSTADGISIKEIALNCGFKDLEVFYRQFRRQVGITPGQYRKKYSVFLQETEG